MAEVFQYMPQKKFFLTLLHIFKSEWEEWGENGQVNDVFMREYFLGKYFLCKGKFDVRIVRSAGPVVVNIDPVRDCVQKKLNR